MVDWDIRRVDDGAPIDDAYAVRRSVFIKGQGVSEAEEMDGHDAEASHLVAYEGETPVGTVRLREADPGVAKIERVGVVESHRGEGIGHRLMHEIEDVARKAGMDEALLHAQADTEEFYARLGYETVSDVFEEAGIPHVEMRKGLVRDSWTC